MRTITLLPECESVDADDIEALPNPQIVACDCYIRGVEAWDAVAGGYARGRIVNVDHHADTVAMSRVVSSANLALDRVRAVGLPPLDAAVVITHTDCDSILSSGIMSGRLAAEDHYGQAAIAADHTGDENAIADLLQALDRQRNPELSFTALARLEAGERQPPEIERLVSDRLTKRTEASRAVQEGRVGMRGRIAAGLLPKSLDGEFFASLLTDAVVILLQTPRDSGTALYDVKVRLGQAAPNGLSLHALNIREFDAAYGGRWNAGSNRRGGGTRLSLDAYAQRLVASLERALAV